MNVRAVREARAASWIALRPLNGPPEVAHAGGERGAIGKPRERLRKNAAHHLHGEHDLAHVFVSAR